MRLSTLALYLAPLLVGADVAHDDGTAVNLPTSDAPLNNPATVNFVLEKDGEALAFDISSIKLQDADADGSSCGPSQLLLDGRLLQQDWQLASNHGRSATSKASTSVYSTVSGQQHTADLSVSSSCLTGPSTAEADRHSDKDDWLEVTTVLVDRIDGRPSKLPVGFTILLDQNSGDVLSVSPATSDDLVRLTRWDESHQHDHPEPVEPANDRDHLATLQLHLERLLSALGPTRIGHSNPDGPNTQHPECNSMRCTLTAVLKSARNRLRLIAQKLPSIPASTTSKCARAQTVLGSILNHSKNHCQLGGTQQLSSSIANVESVKGWQAHAADILSDKQRSDRVRDYILLPVAVLAIGLCFTCVSFRLCRTCCSPRAKADWAARCEEVRNRRQYRRLQRRHAIHQWWNRIIGKPRTPSSGDYEEKRRLIISQEDVLESAMQNEMRLLRLEAGMTPEEISTEEYQQARSIAETLPPYRPQGSEGPPSYRTELSDAGSARHSRSGSRTGSVSGGMSPLSEASSDSSVAALSPRHSSETLRTDGSLV